MLKKQLLPIGWHAMREAQGVGAPRADLPRPSQGVPRRQASAGRRAFLQAAGLAAAGWLTPVAAALARQEDRQPRGEPAQSVILVWLGGGPSQLETFDPHPGKAIAGGTRAIDTALRGVQLAEGYGQLAAMMDQLALVRNVVSREGDHERGTYAVKTGYRPDPTVVHPSLGAIVCHQLSTADCELPRHVSIMPGRWPGRGGMLGGQYDAFKTFDPLAGVPDVEAKVDAARLERRLADRGMVDGAFAAGRAAMVESTLHGHMVDQAVRMMSSQQLAAFDVRQEPRALRDAYGDNPFARGCLAARRLIESGVRCVEVNLNGWDSHTDNHEVHRHMAGVLDPALAALLGDLRERELWERTLVVCCGEFGRTPKVNGLGGRDHWPSGFSVLLAGGRLRRGVVRGATDPGGEKVPMEKGTAVADIHATILTALGIDPRHEELAPAGRPIKFSEGKAIAELLA